MNWIKGAWNAVTGNSKVVEKGVEVFDDVVNTHEERQEADAAYTTQLATAPSAPSYGTWIDVLVDGFTRLIRPGTFTWLTLGITGVIELPDISKVDPYYQSLYWLGFTFYFGGRALMKDLPKAVGSILEVSRKYRVK